MSYAVKEMFLTLQGEGVQAGRRAVFVRFAGCNLWTGREEDRASAICRFCDTDFVGMDGLGGGRFADAAALVEAVTRMWDGGDAERFVVLTGGEPMLQVDDALVDALHAANFFIAIESNGTLAVHPRIDWVCISPKAGSETVQRSGDELKLVWPQAGSDVDAMEEWDFPHLLIQPLDDPDAEANRDAAVALVMQRPRWRLTLQTHKMLGLR
ncbi:7-carboxy-7-deazaguanine synthase [uncultured Sphingomonas sp.]|uniref:7-carboxy-7-deazaguanine synthase n=1 Tax=uncultured Sphingomonas sp. TaxID=158754 RepID=UPI0026242E1C|nr:7-carboxy-7-deazaguanine synthase [uncultured Sphingomonas sp.]